MGNEPYHVCSCCGELADYICSDCELCVECCECLEDEDAKA